MMDVLVELAFGIPIAIVMGLLGGWIVYLFSE